MKRWLLWGTVTGTLLVVYLLRYTLLSGIGTILIDTDEPRPTEAIFVLAGGPVERGKHAAHLYHAGMAPHIYCTGEIVTEVASLFCDSLNEGQITQGILTRAGVPDSAISILPEGTSTLEECYDIIRYCKANNLTRIMVISSILHTRRIAYILRPRGRRHGIDICIVGAPPQTYSPEQWYKAEEGLLFVTNEYLKMAYYLYKY